MSTRSCSALITSSDLATARSLLVAASTAGRPVVISTALSRGELTIDSRSAVKSAEMADRSVPVKAVMSGCATQLPPPTASRAGNAAGSTSSGPYVVNPAAATVPAAGTVFSFQ